METYVRDGDYIQGLLALLSLTYEKYYTARIMPKMYYRQKNSHIFWGDIRGKLNYCFLERCLFLKSLLTWLREKGSNLRPSGYEPDELPLLYPAILSE